MNFSKKLISLFLALSTLLTTISGLSFSAQAKEKNVENVDCSSNVSIESDYEAFDIFSDAVNEVKDASVTEVNNISRITFSENTATVNLKTTKASKLLVGVYTEDETKLLGVGTENITDTDTEVKVKVNITMPEYFIAKGYIVDSYTMKPISTVYTCTYYTSDMQQLFDSNIDSFDRDKVINFDDSYNNNFAVYNDDVIQEDTSETSNIVISDDDNTCVVSNASDKIKNLKKGDVLSLGSDYENLIYLKVQSVLVENNTVTIMKNTDVQLTDLFECVKISNSDDLYDVEKIAENKQDSYGDISVYSSDQELDDNKVKKKTTSIGEFSGSAKATGNLSLTLTLGCDIFVSFTKRSSISIYLDYNLKFNFDVNVKGNADFNKLKGLKFYLAGGILCISVTPRITVDFNLEIHLVIEYYGRIGMSLDTSGNFTNTTTPSTLTGNLDAEGKLVVNFGLETALTVIDGPEFIKGYITPRLILTATSKLDNSHECVVCFAGNLSYDFNLDFGIRFCKNEKLHFKKSTSLSNGELCKFYYSASTGKFGTGLCPNRSNNLLRILRIINNDGTSVGNATVQLYKKNCTCSENDFMHKFFGLSHYKLYKSYKSDRNGFVKFYLDAKENSYEYSINATYGNMYGRYYFPWGGGNNNYVYPITLKYEQNKSSSSYSFDGISAYKLDKYAIENYSVDKSTDSNNIRSLKFTNLTPNEKYNFYSFKEISQASSDDITKDNAIYFNQYVADQNGELTISYKSVTIFTGGLFGEKKEPKECLLAMGQDDISISDIKQADISCKSDENSVCPMVTVCGRMLVEGVDYLLQGDTSPTTSGEHTFEVVGIGNYKGKVACKYKSTLYKDEYKNVCEKAQILIGKSYYTQKSKDILKNAVEGTKDLVSSANNQSIVDNAVNEINQKIDELVLIDHFEDITKDGVKFEWNKEDQSLKIFGTGNITSPCDWDLLKNNVKVLVIKNVTNIENGAFSDYKILNSVSFDSNIKSVSNGAFSGCENLTDVYYVRNSNEWRKVVSSGETGLENATVHSSSNCVPNGHTWGEWKYNNDAVYNSSSDYKDGTQTRTCSACGESETKEAPNTALLRRRGNALSLESSITLATYITKDVVDYYDEVYAEFTGNGKTEKVYPSDKTLTSNSTVYCIFYYTGISPQALGDNVSITFYGIKDGVTYNGNAYKYSATDYIKSTLNKPTSSAKLKTLLVDLVYYGEACQVYQNYKTDNLLTDILTDEQKAFHSTGDLNLTNIKNSKYSLCDNRLVKFGTALRLNNSVKMAIAMNMTNVTLEELSLKVKKGSRTMTYSYSKNPENFGKGKDGYWYFYFDGVYANQMSDEVLITAYKGSEQVSYTLKYSVESYAAIVTDAKIKAVTDAMMRYGNSAKAYVGK